MIAQQIESTGISWKNKIIEFCFWVLSELQFNDIHFNINECIKFKIKFSEIKEEINYFKGYFLRISNNS